MQLDFKIRLPENRYYRFLHRRYYCKNAWSTTEGTNRWSTFAFYTVWCRICTIVTDWLTLYMYYDCTTCIVCDYAYNVVVCYVDCVLKVYLHVHFNERSGFRFVMTWKICDLGKEGFEIWRSDLNNFVDRFDIFECQSLNFTFAQLWAIVSYSHDDMVIWGKEMCGCVTDWICSCWAFFVSK